MAEQKTLPIPLDPRTMFDLSGRTVLITGGGRGLGRALAEAVGAAGARIILAGRSAASLKTAAAELQETYGAEVTGYSVDLADRKSTIAFGERLLREHHRVDVFVQNAGYEGLQPIESVTEDVVDAVIATNLSSTILLSRALVPEMKANGWGRLIFVTSATTCASDVNGHSVYTATKCGLEGLARTLAVELGRSAITANCISPGCYLTDQAQGVLSKLEPTAGKAAYDVFAKMSAAGRWGAPSDLMGALLLLASDAGRFITGEVLRVDGGLAIKLTPS